MHIGLFVKDFAVGTKFNKDGLPTKSNRLMLSMMQATILIHLNRML